MLEGTIKKLTGKSFGFIETGSGKDLFFHSSSLQGVSFKKLETEDTQIFGFTEIGQVRL